MRVDGLSYKVSGFIRPGASAFIEKMSKIFDIVIFTASLESYAKKVIKKIDRRNHIKYILTRDECTVYKNNFIKDLRRFGRDLSDVIIIDNNPVAYAFNKENGIPIESWFEDQDDIELYSLIPKLEELAKYEDVRYYIRNELFV